jgi:GH24 family phage-related lysozyme (muramidase)
VLAFVGGFEGRSLVAYRDIVGIATICDGDTKNVRMGMKATHEECDERTVRRLIEHEDGMLRCLKVDLPDGPRLAFLSMTYNVGVAAFCNSTLLRKANAGDIRGACNELPRWNRAGGKEVRGLTRRRLAEQAICLNGLPP